MLGSDTSRSEPNDERGLAMRKIAGEKLDQMDVD